MPSIGVARICIQPVAYNDHVKSGRRVHVMPSHRSLWIVVTKFNPVRIDENPKTKIANPCQTDICRSNFAKWNVECPSGIRWSTTGKKRANDQNGSGNVEPPGK